MKTESNLEKILAAGHLAVTGECGPPRGCKPEEVIHKSQFLKGIVDAVNVTDNQTAMVRMSSLAASVLIKQEGLNPLFQVTCRDRNRLAMQADIIGAYSLGIDNMLCLSGDHTKFGDHPEAKDIGQLLETEPFLLHLAPDRIQALLPAQDGRFNAVATHDIFNRLADILDDLAAAFPQKLEPGNNRIARIGIEN